MGLTRNTQRYAWPFRAETGQPNPSNGAYFEVDGPPCSWIILAFYNPASIVTGFEGVNFSIEAELLGTGQRAVFNNFSSTQILPAVGALFSALGERVYPFVQAFEPGLAYEGNFWGIPLIDGQAPLLSDVERVPVGTLLFGVIPPFSCAIAADPPGQTIEILDVSLTVVQTIVLSNQNDFAPINAKGVFMQNTAAVNTLFWFKRKNIF